MCGRYNEHLPKMHGWAEALRHWPADHVPRYNRAPTTPVVAFRGESGEVMRWGLVPAWSKEFDSKYATFNARIEGIDSKPTFRSAWKNARRCLVPMAGYYEWTGSKGSKQPFYITDRDVGCMVAAGLYEQWGDDQLSCTIITKPANDMLKGLHPRMPVFLNPEEGEYWLAGETAGADEFLREAHVDSVIYHPVSTAVGNVRNDGPELIEPIDV